MKKKIYNNTWLECHPYTDANATDRYYVGIANHIYQILVDTEINLDDDWTKKTAITITAWFEDIISQTGIWQCFTEECERRYGARIPFYPIGEDYFPDEVNQEDIRFLLWHCLQQRYEGEKIINPENPGIEIASSLIYELLSEEYETAPENERMQAFMKGPETMKEADFMAYRKRLEWFHFHCYISIGNEWDYMESCQEIIEEEFNKEEDIDDHHAKQVDMSLYNEQVDQMLNSRNGLLSLTSTEWMKRIWKRNGTPEGPWEEVETLRPSFYRYLAREGDVIRVQNLLEEKQELLIQTASLDIDMDELTSGKNILIAQLTRFGHTWWHNGMMAILLEDEQLQIAIQKEKDIRMHLNEKLAFKDFMKACHGKPFVFCRDKKELEAFLTKKMGYKNATGLQYPEDIQQVMLTATPSGGLYIQMEHAECICSADNPFYDAQEAEKNAFLFIVNPDVIPYEISCILQDKHMLPEACLNSIHGKEHGKMFMQKHIQFLTDYFHHRYREKDFNDPELLK